MGILSRTLLMNDVRTARGIILYATALHGRFVGATAVHAAVDMAGLGYQCIEHASTEHALHVLLTKQK